MRNLADGRVEIVLQGERGQLERLIQVLKQCSFPIRIDEVFIEPCDIDGSMVSFEMI
ncbi:MAG: acylphosphatase [Simkania sp.]|nr:acylphosphatase [Simkania sp.]